AKVGMVYLRMPSTAGERMMSNALGFVQDHAGLVTKLAALVVAGFLALGFSGEWNTYLLSVNGGEFGVKDPIFSRDVGFFVFELPWLLAMANFAFGLLLLTTLLTVGIYIGMQVLAALAQVELSKPFVRRHVSTLIALTVLAYAAQLWLRRYGFGYYDSHQFTGAGYAGIQQLAVQTLLAFLVAALAVAIFVGGSIGRPFRIAIYGGAATAALYVVGMWIYPAVVQRVTVEPNKLQVEGPYAERAIRMTRWAYGLDKIAVKDTDVRDEPTPEELAAAGPTLENMRLWDPDVLRQSIEGLQGLRPYYTFHDVDVDRYEIDGRRQMVMLAPRDIRLEGLSEQARAWVNTRLQYTHGFGIVMSPVNESTPQGQPTFIVKDVPPKVSKGIQIEQPRIYFSDFRDPFRGITSEYALVNTGIPEFDYPAATADRQHRWTGTRGIPVSGMLARLAASAVLTDGNLLISGNIQRGTKLLIRRNVIERASLVFPFLKFDNDPYIVVFGGRLTWILDAYSATERIPYSERIGTTERLNYIRNSVKVTIDAYDGTMNAYAVLPDEPLLKAYRRIFPRLIKDGSQVPQGLRAHFRYPEDMFKLQAMQLTQYHVTHPVSFLNNEDAWELPTERLSSGATGPMEPYFVQIGLPETAPTNGDADEFLLILPFTPRNKQNLSGWLAARCDPENYGQLLLFRYPKDRVMAGPAQMEARFNQDKYIADINRQFTNEQSEIVPGNLLVVPIGQSILYVKPLFLKSRSSGIQPIPELKKVVLALNTRVVVGDTYEEALARLFDARAPAPDRRATGTPEQGPAPGAQEPRPGAAVDREALRGALRLLDEAEQALRQGDFGRYGDLQRQARERLRELAGSP
ncbi:MAG TPA: UPF0182 family protein, partial [Fimbriimonadaceae bacterium]|nr:UPF0182 family protein [Fimbriimonadaceae bacterium]